MKKSFLFAAALAAIVPTSAFAQHPCLVEDQIWNYNAINDKTLIVEDMQHRKFRLKLIGACQNLAFHQHLAFKSVGGSGISCLSTGDLVLTHEIGTGPASCAVTRIEPYTPDMQAADRAMEKGHGGY
jgi:hypothetical protein